MSNSLGSLIIVAAASGTGKTSLVNRLISEMPDIALSISHTTRPRRSQEQEGKHYYFVDEPVFKQMIERDAFLEYARVFDYFYGTAKLELNNKLSAGQDVILEIDWQGARQIRRRLAQAVSIFILPPSLTALEARLRTRNQDDPAVIAKRLARAGEEIIHANEFDFWVINDDFEQALAELKTIILAMRLRQVRQTIAHANLLAELTKKY